jgi:exportin-2 (importin alpha re-exporter)
VEEIVIPNLMFRDSEEERFYEKPIEFVVKEVEESNIETRRKCSQSLLQAMLRQFEDEATTICMGHIDTMLNEFAADPEANWKAKHAAVRFPLVPCFRVTVPVTLFRSSTSSTIFTLL